METLLIIVTLLSVGVAIAASILSWRIMRQDRLRSEARIAALAGDIETDHTPLQAAGEAIASRDEQAAPIEFPIRQQEVDVHSGPFSAPRSERTGGRLAAVAAAGALVVATIVGGIVLSSGKESPRLPVREKSPAVSTVSAPEVPIELIALGHERESGRLTVRGVVRGPASRIDASLTAVVLLFDHEGEFIASGRAQVGDADAAPGDDRRFMVSVPAGAQVSRYRVSFRSDDHIVPHVDKRNPVI